MSQSAFESIYRQWTWLGIPAMVIAAAALILLITGVVRTIKRAHLFRVPLMETQEIQFAEAGRVVLSMEGPRFSTGFAGVDFELTGMDGSRVQGELAWFRARTSGISTVRMELLKFDIPRPGRYVLRTRRLGAGREEDARHAVVFMRPHLKQLAGYILGIVLASGVLLTSLVFFLLRLYEGNSGT